MIGNPKIFKKAIKGANKMQRELTTKPKMKEKTKWYWHIHHQILVEVLTEPLQNRIEYIKKEKPEKEVKLRLKLLKPVKGQLPIAMVKAGEVYAKAWEAYVKAWEAYDKAREVYNKAREVSVKAWGAPAKAWEVYAKARKDNVLDIEKLHQKECPNCPWNGETIFPKEEGKRE